MGLPDPARPDECQILPRVQVRERRQLAQRGGVPAAYAVEVEPLEGLGGSLRQAAQLEQRTYHLVVALVRQVREDRLERGQLVSPPMSRRTASSASSSGDMPTSREAARSLTRL